jgi:hypothetical protein
MISYLVIACQTPVYIQRSPCVPASPDTALPSPPRLQVEDLVDTRAGENMVTSPDPFREAERKKQIPQFVETDVGVGRTPNYPQQN